MSLQLSCAKHGVGRFIANTYNFSRITKRNTLTVNCDKDGISSVNHLFSARRPSTISRLVITVIVYALYLVRFRARPHISNEVLKIHPSFTYLDPPAAVESKVILLRVPASSLHVLPYGIFSTSAHFMSDVAANLFKAAAAFCVPILKIERCNHNHRSAVASTHPFHPSLASLRFQR